MTPPTFDRIDRHILAALQLNARTSNADIARELEMAPSAILERIRKLEQREVIAGYEARITPKAVGLGLTAFLFIRADEPGGSPNTANALAAAPEVHEVHQVAGEDCFLVKLRARDTEDLSRILRERISALPHVRQTRTTIVLLTTKESGLLPLHQLESEPADLDRA
jgi:Lrp/AsnC family transcriptional regulator, leucine-responsive regulatory protein